MVYFTVMYPYKENMRFDMDYYLHHHLQLVKEKVGEALKEVHVDRGVSGGAPDSTPAYAVIARLRFDSPDDLAKYMAPHSPVFQADIPNFTDVVPVIQISEAVV